MPHALPKKSGPVSAELYATTDASDTDVTAKLIVVKPTGMALKLWTPSFGRDNGKADYLSKRHDYPSKVILPFIPRQVQSVTPKGKRFSAS
jgi:predicted acyl esterase